MLNGNIHVSWHTFDFEGWKLINEKKKLTISLAQSDESVTQGKNCIVTQWVIKNTHHKLFL